MKKQFAIIFIIAYVRSQYSGIFPKLHEFNL